MQLQPTKQQALARAAVECGAGQRLGPIIRAARIRARVAAAKKQLEATRDSAKKS